MVIITKVCLLIVFLLLSDHFFSLSLRIVSSLSAFVLGSSLLLAGLLSGLLGLCPGGCLCLVILLDLPLLELVGTAHILFLRLSEGLHCLSLIITLLGLDLLLESMQIIRLSAQLLLLSQGMLLALELASPLVLLALILTLFRGHLGVGLLALLPLFGYLFEFLLLLAGLHEVILTALAFLEYFVADALLAWILVRDVINSVMLIVLVLCGCMQVLIQSLLHVWIGQLRLDIVKIVHLFTFVVLEKALVGAEVLLVLSVESVCNAVECFGVDLVQHVLAVGLPEHVSVVAATLG